MANLVVYFLLALKMFPNNSNKSLVFVLLIIGIGTSLFAQVGIGTTNPQATLHIKGNYVAPVYNTSHLLNENFDSYSLNQALNSNGTCNNPYGWVVTNTPQSGYGCLSCTGNMLYINSDGGGCSQDATVKVPFGNTPTTTTIFISFDFNLVRQGTNDRLRAYLYNNSDNTSTLIYDAQANLNGTATGSYPVIAGDSYSLHFNYTGLGGYGATVDNAKVTEQLLTTPGEYAIKVEDNTAHYGYVLTADGSGNATWKPIPGAAARPGSPELMQFTGTTSTPPEILRLFLKKDPTGANNSNDMLQKELIQEMRKMLNEQQQTIEEQNRKIQDIEKNLQALKAGGS